MGNLIVEDFTVIEEAAAEQQRGNDRQFMIWLDSLICVTCVLAIFLAMVFGSYGR